METTVLLISVDNPPFCKFAFQLHKLKSSKDEQVSLPEEKMNSVALKHHFLFLFNHSQSKICL